jgi:hypothetical protein
LCPSTKPVRTGSVSFGRLIRWRIADKGFFLFRVN